MTAFLDTAPCSLFETDRCFRVTYYLHHQDDDCTVLYPEKAITFILTTMKT
jgi:hypothetical protein